MNISKKFPLKPVTAAVLAMCFMFSSTANASGIPVVDAGTIAHAVIQVEKMTTQITNQIEQITQLKAQVKSLTGTRNLGKILSYTVKEQVPDEWKNIYDAAKNKDYKVLINGKNYDPDAHKKQLVTQLDLVEKSFDGVKDRLTNIDKLMDEINNTQDAKAAADLQARIAAEQAQIQVGQTKLTMLKDMMAIQQQINAYQAQDREACYAKNMRTRNYSSCQ